MSFSHSLCVTLYASLIPSVSLYVPLSLPLFHSMCFSHSLCVTLCASHSLCVTLCASHSLCVYVPPSASLCVCPAAVSLSLTASAKSANKMSAREWLSTLPVSRCGQRRR